MICDDKVITMTDCYWRAAVGLMMASVATVVMRVGDDDNEGATLQAFDGIKEANYMLVSFCWRMVWTSSRIPFISLNSLSMVEIFFSC